MMEKGPKKIKVVVVDDSAFMRKALKRMLSSDSSIRVVADARDGEEAVEKVKLHRPDVVTLDVKMTGMDGLEALKRIMAETPTPALMVSSLTSDGGEITLKALELGAVDFIDKSSCHTTMDILEIAESLIEKVKIIAGVDLAKVAETARASQEAQAAPAQVVPEGSGVPSHIVAMAASTGGPMTLEKVLTAIPSDFPGAILVVQHMPIGFTRSLAERFDKLCPMAVSEAEEGMPILPGRVYIAPGGYHLHLQRKNETFHAFLSRTPRDSAHIPSADEMMTSVARKWPGKILGVILTGMGDDGTAGARAIKEAGGRVIAQDEATCVVFGMPRAASVAGFVDKLVPLSEMAREILDFKAR